MSSSSGGCSSSLGLIEILLAFWVAGDFRSKAILLVIYVGIISLTRGISEIFVAFKLKGLRRRLGAGSPDRTLGPCGVCRIGRCAAPLSSSSSSSRLSASSSRGAAERSSRRRLRRRSGRA